RDRQHTALQFLHARGVQEHPSDLPLAPHLVQDLRPALPQRIRVHRVRIAARAHDRARGRAPRRRSRSTRRRSRATRRSRAARRARPGRCPPPCSGARGPRLRSAGPPPPALRGPGLWAPVLAVPPLPEAAPAALGPLVPGALATGLLVHPLLVPGLPAPPFP